MVGVISARGVSRGIEAAAKVRAPILLVLLVMLAAYALSTGDARAGLRFAFRPNVAAITPQVALAAVGQAFYATGVGGAMMLAYGSYVARGTSLVRSALIITGSILLVSLLATLTIFPLVFQYGMNPAQGPELVFEVLATVFAEMPGGRLVGTLFFMLLVFAALTPSIAGFEPLVAWLQQRRGLSRAWAVASRAVGGLGVGHRIGAVVQRMVRLASARLVPGVCGQDLFRCVGFRVVQRPSAGRGPGHQRAGGLAPFPRHRERGTRRDHPVCAQALCLAVALCLPHCHYHDADLRAGLM